MIYVNENRAQIVKGDFHPSELYKGSTRIAGYTKEAFEGEGGITLENCYNDKLHSAQITGNSVQDGAPSPESPIEVKSVGGLVTEEEHSGKYKIGVTARGKNLFKFIDSAIANGNTIDVFKNGAIVQGNIAENALTGAYARGWFRPGYTAASGICPELKSGDIVTVSADVTLLELRQDDNYVPSILLYSRDGGNAKYTLKAVTVKLNETKRISCKFTIPDIEAPKIYYPAFALNSNTVKIENIQIEYGDTDTEYEEYKEPQSIDIYLEEPLRRIGDKEDFIDFENGRIIRNVNFKVFTGDEIWYRQDYRLYCSCGSVKGLDSNVCHLLNNRYVSYTWENIAANIRRAEGERIIGAALQAGSYFCVTPAQTVPEIEEWEAQLKAWNDEGTPLTAVYEDSVREEEIDLPSLPTFRGTTIYEINTEITAKIGGEYKRVE